MRDLIARKLAGQAAIARDRLRQPLIAARISWLCDHLSIAESLDDVRHVEAAAAKTYWRAWSNVSILWSRSDARRVPSYWLHFTSRISPLAPRLSPRHAINPANAILNYLYALLESQCRIAAIAHGLDPGLGLLHRDSKQRDSLALDIMEPLRPLVDAAVLDLLAKPLDRRNFHEHPDGQCWITTAYCRTLAALTPAWEGPIHDATNYISKALGKTIPRAEGRAPRGRDKKRRSSA